MDDNSTTTKRALLSISLFVNSIIVIYSIYKIGYTSEFAGWIIDLWNRIVVIFLGIGLTSICCFLVHSIYKNRHRYSNSISTILVVAVSIMYYSICISIINPKQYDRNEILEDQSEELSRMIKRGNKMLEKSNNVLNNHTIKLEDSIAIINYFSNFLDSSFYLYSDSIKTDYASKFHYFFNRNLDVISDSVETNKYRQIIRNKLSIDLFLYSPNKEKIFIIITYEVGNEPTEANALALIGERNDNKIVLYRYDNFTNDDGVVNKKHALYQIITDFDYGDIPSERCNISPLSKYFWDGWWYEKVKINDTEKYRYQLDDYAYKWNEKKQYNERVTEEIKTFIMIEK